MLASAARVAYMCAWRVLGESTGPRGSQGLNGGGFSCLLTARGSREQRRGDRRGDGGRESTATAAQTLLLGRTRRHRERPQRPRHRATASSASCRKGATVPIFCQRPGESISGPVRHVEHLGQHRRRRVRLGRVRENRQRRLRGTALRLTGGGGSTRGSRYSRTRGSADRRAGRSLSPTRTCLDSPTTRATRRHSDALAALRHFGIRRPGDNRAVSDETGTPAGPQPEPIRFFGTTWVDHTTATRPAERPWPSARWPPPWPPASSSASPTRAWRSRTWAASSPSSSS